MSKIAVLIDDLFEDAEYTQPANAFKQADNELVHVGMKAGLEVNGKKEGTPVVIDRAVTDVSVSDFDALFIPGGYSPDKLRAYKSAVNFVRDFVRSNKPVFLICHAPQLLITANVARGRKLTGWVSIVQDIKNAGAQFLDQAVVEDGNLISSRGPQDIPEFIEATMKKMQAMVQV